MSAIRNSEVESLKLLLSDKSRLRRPKNVQKLSSFLSNFDLFKAILERNGLTNFLEIAANFSIKNYGFGETIYNSAQSRTFNFIVRGAVMLFTNRPISQQTTKTQLDQADLPENEPTELHFYKRLVPNEYFGQRLFVMQHYKVACAQSASTNTLVIQLQLATLYKTFSGYFIFKELEEKVHMLRKVVALRYLSSRKLEKILQMGTTKKLHNSFVLFKEGQTPSNLIIILEGEVTLNKKVTEPTTKNVNLSILSAYEVLGLTEIIRGDPYYSTAICTADRTEILSIDKQIIREMFDYQMENELDVYRYKEDWRRSRIELLNQTSIKFRKSSNSSSSPKYNKYVRLLTEPSDTTVEFAFEDRNKMNMTELQTARQKRMIRRFLSQSKQRTEPATQQRTMTSLGDQLFTKYMQKKCKQNFKILKQYTSSHPPEMSNNPEKDFSIIKPLFVHKSNAVRNTKRQLKASRRQIYTEFLNMSLTSQKSGQT